MPQQESRPMVRRSIVKESKVDFLGYIGIGSTLMSIDERSLWWERLGIGRNAMPVEG